MAKARNQVIYSSDPTSLEALKEDYEFLGRRVSLDTTGGRLTVFALPSTWKRKEKKASRQRRSKEDQQPDLN